MYYHNTNHMISRWARVGEDIRMASNFNGYDRKVLGSELSMTLNNETWSNDLEHRLQIAQGCFGNALQDVITLDNGDIIRAHEVTAPRALRSTSSHCKDCTTAEVRAYETGHYRANKHQLHPNYHSNSNFRPKTEARLCAIPDDQHGNTKVVN